MINMQALIDGMNAHAQRERAASQLTLGRLIEALEALPPDAEVENLTDLHSYRGYYSDLAFSRHSGRIKASELLAVCRNAMGEVFEGYKGGDYVMGKLTPLWLASYGSCGVKLMALRDDGTFETAEDES